MRTEIVDEVVDRTRGKAGDGSGIVENFKIPRNVLVIFWKELCSGVAIWTLCAYLHRLRRSDKAIWFTALALLTLH